MTIHKTIFEESQLATSTSVSLVHSSTLCVFLIFEEEGGSSDDRNPATHSQYISWIDLTVRWADWRDSKKKKKPTKNGAPPSVA
mmetsp:Transcript_10581/g.23490  ORF Transcript_10581/g.23490 Transcript_10581/m.23490 type:complete len:84 (-) Transcript_10581:1540-1791(-)